MKLHEAINCGGKFNLNKSPLITGLAAVEQLEGRGRVAGDNIDTIENIDKLDTVDTVNTYETDETVETVETVDTVDS